MTQQRVEVKRIQKPEDFRVLDKSHPIRHVLDSCHKLVEVTSARMDDTFRESDTVGRQARLAMLLLGLGGPIGGILCGYGIARGLSRTIYQLSVRVQDINQRLDQDVAAVNVAADGDLAHLDQQLQAVVRRVEDVAERVQRHQRDMLRAEQLSAVGQLAASVAHEVRNPLTSVKLLVEAALRSSNRKQLSLDDLQVIHGAVCRLEQTVQSFLDFARLPSPERSTGDLRGVVDQAVDLVRARARQQAVEIAVHCPNRPVLADVDAGQLGTVLVNLLLNALDAMPRGGAVAIDLGLSPDAKIQIRVSDTGPGISGELMSRLFTPFVSSKQTGTGLGLSISRRIVEEHDGRITASNPHGGGACFVITLPAAPARVPPVEPAFANAAGEDHANPAGH
jgi:two-component system sensor histidine kinase HydH